jgi:hypothetical protein
VFHVVQNLGRGPLEVRAVRESSLACRNTLFELLVTGEGSNSTSHEITEGRFPVSLELFVSLHEGLNTNIKFKGSLILGIDTLENGEQVKLEAFNIGETFKELLNLFSSGFFFFLNLSKEDLSRSLTDVLTKAEPVAGLIFGNGIRDLVKDLYTIDDKILTNVPSE